MTRKSPIKHKVRTHKRKNKIIHSFTRGKGLKQQTADPTIHKRVTLKQVHYGGNPHKDVDYGILHVVKKFTDDLGFHTFASCEGHVNENILLQAYIASYLFLPKQVEQLRKIIESNNFKPVSRMGFLPNSDPEYMSSWTKPKANIYYYADNFQKEYPDYYLTFEIKYQKSFNNSSLNPESFTVRITPKYNIYYDYIQNEKGFEVILTKNDPRKEQFYTEKKPTQQKWNKIREKAFINVINMLKKEFRKQ